MGTPTESEDLADLIALHQEAMTRPGPEHSLKRPDDPSLPEFLEGRRRGWSDAEHGLVPDSSPYAVRLQKLAWRVDPPPLEALFRWQVGVLRGFEATAMKEHLAEPEGRPSRLLLNSPWWRRLIDAFRPTGGIGAALARPARTVRLRATARSPPPPALCREGWRSWNGQEFKLRCPATRRRGTLSSSLLSANRQPNGRVELIVLSCDQARVGQRMEAHLIGASGLDLCHHHRGSS